MRFRASQNLQRTHFLSLFVQKDGRFFHFYRISTHVRDKYSILRGIFWTENTRKALILW
jgi:hypothetical protein